MALSEESENASQLDWRRKPNPKPNPGEKFDFAFWADGFDETLGLKLNYHHRAQGQNSERKISLGKQSRKVIPGRDI